MIDCNISFFVYGEEEQSCWCSECCNRADSNGLAVQSCRR